MKKRILSILLLCCMVLTLLPATAFAVDGESAALPPDTGSLCECHPEHDEVCGYTEGTEDAPGTPCGHVCEIRESGDGGDDPAGPAGTSGAAMSRTLLGAARPAATQYTYTLHYDANGGSGAGLYRRQICKIRHLRHLPCPPYRALRSRHSRPSSCSFAAPGAPHPG